MKYKSKKYKKGGCMSENSYNHIRANIPNIAQQINEDLFTGFGQRLGLAGKEYGFRLLQKAHELNRASQQRRLVHAQEIDNRILYSAMHKASGFSPREIINLQYSPSASERALATSIKTSVLSSNPNLARYTQASKEYKQRRRASKQFSTSALTSPKTLSSIRSTPGSAPPSVKQRISQILSVNPRKAADTLQTLRNIKNIQRKNQLLARGANQFRIGLETGLV
jgi:hypothetical protein